MPFEIKKQKDGKYKLYNLEKKDILKNLLKLNNLL